MSKNLIDRIIVAIVFIPLILWISYEGGWPFYGFVLFLAAIAISEFLIVEGYKLSQPAFWAILIATLGLVSFYSDGHGWLMEFLPIGRVGILVGVFLFSGMFFTSSKRPPAELMKAHARLMWGVIYIGMLYPFVYSLGNIVDVQASSGVSGGDALLFLFAILWIGDTAAMYVGKTFGKHKLAPTVSPNKTVEGFVGGLVSAVIVGIVMGYWKFNEFPMYQILIVAVLCSLFGQLGDLVESMWKRSLNIKDSSAIIPGHGGFLDRFDSLLFAAPVMYYFFVIFR